jgi:hypothetical protein
VVRVRRWGTFVGCFESSNRCHKDSGSGHYRMPWSDTRIWGNIVVRACFCCTRWGRALSVVVGRPAFALSNDVLWMYKLVSAPEKCRRPAFVSTAVSRFKKGTFDNCWPRQSEESNIPSMRGVVSRVWTCLLWLQGCLWVCDILFFCFFNVLSSPVHFSGCKLLAFRTVLGRADNSVLWGVL